MLNVVTNAIDACDRGESEQDERPGNVEISTQWSAADRIVRVTVATTAPVSNQMTSKRFSPSSSRKGGRGTGLGLPVSRKILREHGGQILVKSKLGEGSCFTLEFPATPAEIVRKTDPVIAVHGQLVDDE